MKIRDFTKLVGDMMAAQRAYFNSREREDLVAAKQLETKTQTALSNLEVMLRQNPDVELRKLPPPLAAVVKRESDNPKPYTAEDNYGEGRR